MSTRQIADPTISAVVTMELQRGVVGDLATMAQLAAVARDSGTLDACGRLTTAARRSAVPVIHATVSWRADRRGTSLNTPLTFALARNPGQILVDSPAVELIPELGDTQHDLISHRHHGLTPFPGTDLDQTLRSLGITTVVACGVSLNVGILGLCLNAADLGYRVVVCRDAVVGVPIEYGRDVLDNTIAMVATLTTTTELLEGWV